MTMITTTPLTAEFRPVSAMARLFRFVRKVQKDRETCAMLSRLDDRFLRDIGLIRFDVTQHDFTLSQQKEHGRW